MATPHDPPWRLDPLKNIVNVGWGSSIAVLTLKARYSKTDPSVSPMTAWHAFFTADCDDADMRGVSLLDGMGPEISPPGPPPTTPINIAAKNNFWHYKDQGVKSFEAITQTYHFTDRGVYNVFTSSGTIEDFVDPLFGKQIPFIVDFTLTGISGDGGFDVYGGDVATQKALGAQMQAIAFNLFDPDPTFVGSQLIEEIAGHNDVVTTNETNNEWKLVNFLNIGRIISRNPDVKRNKRLKIVIQFEGVDARTFLSYTVDLMVFLGVKKFNQDSTNTLNHTPLRVTSIPGKAPVSEKTELDQRIAETRYPTTEITFTLDLQTFKITSSRRIL